MRNNDFGAGDYREPEDQSFGPDGGSIDCPMTCDVPTGYRLIQVLTEPKSFTIPCPNECGRWVRAVGCPDTLEAGRSPDLPLHRTEAGYPNCSTCDGGGCYDCTDPA